MSTVYVFGHKNPDNDAIMSAVVLSQPVSYTHLTLPTSQYV